MKKNIIILIETIVIFLLSFALVAIDQDNKIALMNSPYKMTKYDFLNIDNYSNNSCIQGYDRLNNRLWRECEALLNNVFHGDKNETSLLYSETILKRIDFINQEEFQLQLDTKDEIISNVSVVSVLHTKSRAAVSYVFDVSIVDENGIRKYNCSSNEEYPYILCLVYDQDENQWEIIDILIPV